jgi:hypothetical protein
LAPAQNPLEREEERARRLELSQQTLLVLLDKSPEEVRR